MRSAFCGLNPGSSPVSRISSLHSTPQEVRSTALFGSLAQLVEHRTFNPLVLGSSPRRPTKKHEGSEFLNP